MNSFFPAEGVYPQNYMADQSVLQISEFQFYNKFPHTFNVFMLEEIQNPSECLFQFSPGSNVMDESGGDDRFGGRLEIIALNSGLYSFPEL